MTTVTPTVVAPQFNGPDASGNGGYVAGIVAAPLASGPRVGEVITSTLRVPPPLGVELDLQVTDARTALLDGETVVAEAAPGTFDVEVPPFVGIDVAKAGLEAYEGHADHPFPLCFTCGTARDEGDGLRVFTGPVGDAFPDTVAALWTPHPAFGDVSGHLAPELTWAAIDCPGGWAAHIDRFPMVLGRMTAQLHATPTTGQEYVEVGTLREVDGRKHRTGTALYDLDGTLLARAEQTWITIDIDAFR